MHIKYKKPIMNHFKYSHGAIFSVRKSLIQLKCLKYYKQLILHEGNKLRAYV